MALPLIAPVEPDEPLMAPVELDEPLMAPPLLVPLLVLEVACGLWAFFLALCVFVWVLEPLVVAAASPVVDDVAPAGGAAPLVPVPVEPVPLVV